MFAQRRNRLTTHFSERIPVVTRRISLNYRLKRKSCVAKLVNKWRGDSFLLHLLRLLFAQLPWLSCHALRTDQHVNSCRWFSAFLCYRANWSGTSNAEGKGGGDTFYRVLCVVRTAVRIPLKELHFAAGVRLCVRSPFSGMRRRADV